MPPSFIDINHLSVGLLWCNSDLRVVRHNEASFNLLRLHEFERKEKGKSICDARGQQLLDLPSIPTSLLEESSSNKSIKSGTCETQNWRNGKLYWLSVRVINLEESAIERNNNINNSLNEHGMKHDSNPWNELTIMPPVCDFLRIHDEEHSGNNCEGASYVDQTDVLDDFKFSAESKKGRENIEFNSKVKYLLEIQGTDEQNMYQSVVQGVLETSFDGYWDWFIKINYEYLSPTFWTMFGYNPADMPHSPDSWKHLVHEDDVSKVYQNIDEHFRSFGKIPYMQTN
jgi:hypothetical protein